MSRDNVSEAAPPLVAMRVTPRGGRRDSVIGWDSAGRVIHVRIAASPMDSAANRAVAALVANTLRVHPRLARLVSGKTARDKRFVLTGIDLANLNHRLAALPGLAG